eukprot:424043_1
MPASSKRKQRAFEKRNKKGSKYIFLAVCKLFATSTTRLQKQYKYFSKCIINRILKKYKDCHLRRNIEIDFHHIISILIVSNRYKPIQSLNHTIADDDGCIILQSRNSFSDLLSQIETTFKLSYREIKNIICSLQSDSTFNHLIKKPTLYLNQIAKKMMISVYIIAQKPHHTISFSKSKLYSLQNQLKRSIISQYSCCFLNEEFPANSSSLSVLIVAGYNDGTHASSAPHHIVSKYTNAFQSAPSSFMDWLCVSAKTNLSLSYQNITKIVNLLHHKITSPRPRIRPQWRWSEDRLYYCYGCCHTLNELSKYAQQLSLYENYKLLYRGYCGNLQQSVLLVIGYICMIRKRLCCIAYIPNCIIDVIIKFFHCEYTYEMSRCDDFRIAKKGDRRVQVEIPKESLHGSEWNVLIPKVVFGSRGVYSFKFKVIQWPYWRHRWSGYPQLKFGIVANLQDMDMEEVEHFHTVATYPMYYALERSEDIIIETIINLEDTNLSLIKIAWYINGRCEKMQILEHKKEESYFPFIAVHALGQHTYCDCKDIKIDILY